MLGIDAPNAGWINATEIVFAYEKTYIVEHNYFDINAFPAFAYISNKNPYMHPKNWLPFVR